MLHIYTVRFDVTENLENILDFGVLRGRSGLVGHGRIKNLQLRLYSVARQARIEPTGQTANSPKAESKVAAKKLDLELETSSVQNDG